MNELSTFLFSISIILLLIMNIIQLGKNSFLKEELRKSNERFDKKSAENDEKSKIFNIESGDRAIIPNYNLMYDDKPNKVSFKVTYEVDIIEVSLDKVKVKATGFTSNDSVANDVKNKSGIIKFMENKWVDKSDIEVVIDDSKRRSDKLNQILNEG